MIVIRGFIFITICLFGFCVHAQYKKDFVVFDAIAYKNKPDLTNLGLSRLNLYYGVDIVTNNPSIKGQQDIDILKIKKIALNALESPEIPVCLDVESWSPVGSNKHQALNNYLEVVRVFRSFNTKSRIGYYGLVPYPDFLYQHFWKKDFRKNWYKEWTDVNDFLKPVATAVDISYPSFYTLKKNDSEVWKMNVIAQVKKIKSLKKNIPVYGFLWPQYHPMNGGDANKFLDLKTWEFQLEVLYQYCDGIVVWGTPYYYDKGKIVYMTWDENSVWWKTLKKFILKYRIKSNSGQIRNIR